MSLATFAHPSLHSNTSITKETFKSRDFHTINELLLRLRGKEAATKSSSTTHNTTKNDCDNNDRTYSQNDHPQKNNRKRLLASKKTTKLMKGNLFLIPPMESWSTRSGEYYISNKELFDLLDLKTEEDTSCICRNNNTSTTTFKKSEKYTGRRRKINLRPWTAPKQLLPSLFSPSNLESELEDDSFIPCDALIKTEKNVENDCGIVDDNLNMNQKENHGNTFITNNSTNENEFISHVAMPYTNRVEKILRPRTSLKSQRKQYTTHRKKLKKKTLLAPNPTPIEPLSLSSRQRSFLERDQRIKKAKQSRLDTHHRELTKLVSKLETKQRTRSQQAITNERHRRIFTIVWTIKLACQMHHWLKEIPQMLEEFRRTKKLNVAASKIQILWKKEMFVRKAMEARTIRKKLHSIGWRLKIWSRCARRRLNAQLIRRFLRDYRDDQHMNYVIYTFRVRVIKAQRLVRSFIQCKRARLYVLEKYWMDVERQAMVKDGIRTKRRKKYLLADALHRKVLTKGSRSQHPVIGHSQSSDGSTSDDTLDLKHSAQLNAEDSVSDLEMCRTICRFHLEDSRLSHIQRSTEKMNQFGDEPILDQSHAVILLSGRKLAIDWVEGRSKRWPFFMFYNRTKERFHQTIEELRCEENVSRKKVEKRVLKEECMNKANRFAGIEQDKNLLNTYSKQDENEKIARNFTTSISSIEELREIFDLVDHDSGGTICCDELGKLYDLLGMHKDSDEIQQMMRSMIRSSNNNGDLSFGQFVISLRNKKSLTSLPYSEEMVLCAFQSFAKSTDGTIGRGILMDTLLSFSGKWTKSYALSTLRDAGWNANIINYVDFIRIIFQLWK